MVHSSGPKVYVWEDANAECQSVGSELASIHSKYENEFVESLIKSQPAVEDVYWIGLYRNDEGKCKFWQTSLGKKSHIFEIKGRKDMTILSA